MKLLDKYNDNWRFTVDNNKMFFGMSLQYNYFGRTDVIVPLTSFSCNGIRYNFALI